MTVENRQYIFGSGNVYVTPVGGGAPLKVGALQDVSVDISWDIKQLWGQNQFALALARGKAKIECKAMTGEFNIALFNSMVFNSTVAAASVQSPVFGELGTPTGGTHTITVANAGTAGANFLYDLGVTYAATGIALTQTNSVAPATAGTYHATATGHYAFNTADAALQMSIDYIYKGTAGQTLAINNQLMGQAPIFQLILAETFGDLANTMVMILYSCTANKLAMPLKQDDFEITEIDFQAQANGAGQVLSISTTGS
ncbi:MAG TPA: hypothetical protein VHX64_12470 [Caulobacteraceae bacterium]|jgi:hypothetical protein|nr:hypothetical protein [Caulobacteraceae bacterium]